MPYSKREYDRLNTKYQNTHQRWHKVNEQNKNLIRKLNRRDKIIGKLKARIAEQGKLEATRKKSSSLEQKQEAEAKKK